jgi:hypothetical protein
VIEVQKRSYSPDGPLMRAALRALKTGDAGHILIWIPEESENTLRNLLEKACCERTINRNAHAQIADWYFTTVNRLHMRCYRPRDLVISTKTPEEKKIIHLVERTCQCGDLTEITTVIPDTSGGELQQQLNRVMRTQNFDPGNTAAGRAWVSAFIDFIALVHRMRSGSR